MSDALYPVLLSSVTSEKSSRLADKYRQFVFRVDVAANQNMVKAAVEKFFKVKVQDVQVLNVKGKPRRFGQRLGRRVNWKKAYVTLEVGSDLDFSGLS